MVARKQHSPRVGSMWDLPAVLRGNGTGLVNWLPGPARNPQRLDVFIDCLTLRDCARVEFARRAGFTLRPGWVARARDASPALRRAAVAYVSSTLLV